MKVARDTVHVSDDTGRIAMLENRTCGSDDSAEKLTRYIYSNHLQSASLELDEHAAVISYEEYHPYGTTAFKYQDDGVMATAKRYRYTGKERDEESGLYYHGARYYVPWLCRWSAVDPLEAKYAGMSSYNYSFNNPIVWNDLSGESPGDDNPKPLSANKSNQSLLTARSSLMPPLQTTDHPEDASAVNATKQAVKIAPLIEKAKAQKKAEEQRAIVAAQPVLKARTFDDDFKARLETDQRERDELEAKNRELDPVAYDLGRSPGVQGGLALALPGYGEALSITQIYGGIKTDDETQIALGILGLTLSGYSSFKFYQQGGYQGSLTSISYTANRFIATSEQVISTSGGSANIAQYAQLKEFYTIAQSANEVVESLQKTGALPPEYVTKTVAEAAGWSKGKALNNYVPGGQIGGDIYQNTTRLLPNAAGRQWFEADIGLVNTMGRNKQPGTRLLYSNDGLLYITPNHYETMIFLGRYK